MPVEGKIRLDSNIMREPQRLLELGELAGGIALDLILWGAWNASRHATVLHLPEFCQMFGYTRQHLLRPLNEKREAAMKRVVPEAHWPDFNNSIGFTLLRMMKQNLVFYTNHPDRLPQDISAKTRKARFQSISLLKTLDLETCLKKKSTGTVLTLEFDEQLMENCTGEHYQVVDLQEYTSLKTPGGHPDDRARRMYLRMTWKRQYWDVTPTRKGFYPSRESYDEFKKIAGLDYAQEKKNASLLRKLLRRVCTMPSVQMTATVELNEGTGVYEVKLKREGESSRRRRVKKKPAK